MLSPYFKPVRNWTQPKKTCKILPTNRFAHNPPWTISRKHVPLAVHVGTYTFWEKLKLEQYPPARQFCSHTLATNGNCRRNTCAKCTPAGEAPPRLAIQYAATIFSVQYGDTILWFNMASPYCCLIWLHHITILWFILKFKILCYWRIPHSRYAWSAMHDHRHVRLSLFFSTNLN